MARGPSIVEIPVTPATLTINDYTPGHREARVPTGTVVYGGTITLNGEFDECRRYRTISITWALSDATAATIAAFEAGRADEMTQASRRGNATGTNALATPDDSATANPHRTRRKTSGWTDSVDAGFHRDRDRQHRAHRPAGGSGYGHG